MLPDEIPTTVTMIAVTTGTNVTTATVDVRVSIDASDEQATNGFTLGYNMTSATALNLNLNDQAGNLPMFAERGRLDSSRAAVASTKPAMIECAAFYPNIGQRQLFFQVTSQLPINEAGLRLMSGNPPQGLPATVGQIGDTTDNGVSILRATLDSEITDRMLSVSYLEGPAAFPAEAMCMASLMANVDGDSLIDIVDSNPFDGSDATTNTTIVSGQRVDTPSLLDDYYNRDVIIRSLLAGSVFEPFTYVMADNESTPMRDTFGSGMSIADYLGVRTSGQYEVL